jgi:hypothetical protein
MDLVDALRLSTLRQAIFLAENAKKDKDFLFSWRPLRALREITPFSSLS